MGLDSQNQGTVGADVDAARPSRQRPDRAAEEHGQTHRGPAKIGDFLNQLRCAMPGGDGGFSKDFRLVERRERCRKRQRRQHDEACREELHERAAMELAQRDRCPHRDVGVPIKIDASRAAGAAACFWRESVKTEQAWGAPGLADSEPKCRRLIVCRHFRPFLPSAAVIQELRLLSRRQYWLFLSRQLHKCPSLVDRSGLAPGHRHVGPRVKRHPCMPMARAHSCSGFRKTTG